jgi:membrane protease YdiL (CAAX protease family)
MMRHAYARIVPPAVVPLALVALGVPAALRASIGRPRSLGTAWLAAFAAVAVAQAIGELAGARVGVLGDAQVLFAAAAALVTSALLSLRERAAPGR